MAKSKLFWLNNHLCSLFWSSLLFPSTLSTPYRSFIPTLDFIILKYLIYLWFPQQFIQDFTSLIFFYLNVNLFDFYCIIGIVNS